MSQWKIFVLFERQSNRYQERGESVCSSVCWLTIGPSQPSQGWAEAGTPSALLRGWQGPKHVSHPATFPGALTGSSWGPVWSSDAGGGISGSSSTCGTTVLLSS